jgi:hypothetical protein
MKDNYSIQIHNLTVSLFVNNKKEGELNERNGSSNNEEISEPNEDGIKSFEFGERIDDCGDNFIKNRDRIDEANLNYDTDLNKKNKPWFLSKTISLNSAAAFTGIIGIYMTENQDYNSSAIAVAILSIINIFLRTITKDPIKFK